MYWDKLPPREIEDCPYRSAVRSGRVSQAADCGLLALAGLPGEQCSVDPDVCAACMCQFPPAPDCWNTVIASLLYTRCDRALELGSPASLETSRLARLKVRAAGHLVCRESDVSDIDPAPGSEARAASLRELLPPRRRWWPHRVRSWAVGVVSSPRRLPTLDLTLESVIRAGWDRPYLFLDGTARVHERFGHLPGVLRDGRVGCWPNYYLALAELLLRHPDADAYLLAEDDAQFYDLESLREYLEEMLWPQRRPCLVSLYCPGPYSAHDFRWQALGSEWNLGALAFVFPRQLARAFLLDRHVCAHRWSRWAEDDGGLSNTDLVIGEWAMRRRIPIWYPTPSLVQHIGVTSTLGLDLQATGERRALEWAGSLIAPGHLAESRRSRIMARHMPNSVAEDR
jgi:hypothetical protein